MRDHFTPSPDPRAPLSPLELLHPDGHPTHVRIVGSGCPVRLRGPWGADAGGSDDARADLVIFAPTASECRDSAWLGRAIDSVASALSGDGVAYVLVSPRWRAFVERRLTGLGLTTPLAMLHLPTWEASRFLVPMVLPPAAYALTALIPTHPWKRGALLHALRWPPASRRLSWTLPSVGLVAHRPGGRPMLDWLRRIDPTRQLAGAIVSTSWRGEQGSAVVHRFDRDAQPTMVAKLTWPAEGADDDEPAILRRLGPTARQAGAAVPSPRATAWLGTRLVFTETVVPGRSAAAILDHEPSRMSDVMTHVADWLEKWNRSTRTAALISGSQLADELLNAASSLAPLVDDSEQYCAWLSARCRALDRPLPLVATHNDLTMWNVLLDSANNLGIVDWKEARPAWLPLVDFFYALTDAVVRAHGAPDHRAAFQASFAPSGAYAGLARRLLTRLRHASDVPGEAVDLCLHACFLGHAQNEQRRAAPGDSQPFLHLTRWLALNREAIRDWMER